MVLTIAFSIKPMSLERGGEASACSAKRRLASVLKAISVCLCGVPLMIGCAPLARRPAPPAAYSNAHPAGFSPAIRWVGEMTEGEFRGWAASHLAGPARSAQARPVNVLVLSGGGGAGAFGAGVLTGWSRLGNRPQFQIVTGVSVGALIAPFAFLGHEWDHQLSVAFQGENTPSLLEARLMGWLGALLGWSAFRGAPLRALVDRYVTSDLLRAVATQSASGRLLLVATTDLDSGEVVVWNMGAIASRGGEPALKLFRRVLIASASIPGIFPPVLIPVEASGKMYDELHVDGSASSSFLFAPGIVSILPKVIKPLYGANVYLVINGHLRLRGTTTSRRTLAVLMRSVDTELASDSRARVKLVSSFALRQGMSLNVTEIPSSYRMGGLTTALQPGKMKALFEYGERCAREHRVWADALTVLNRVAGERTSSDQSHHCPVSMRE